MSNINDKNNESKNRTQTIIRALLLVVVFIASATALVSLKQLTDDGPLTPEGLAERDSLHNMAHPDTTDVPEVNPVSPTTDGVTPIDNESPVDSLLTGDARSPLDAGYEDGYYAGMIDGVSGDDRASYDESSQFPDPQQRQAYADGYRRGYAQGYQDGLEGKEFSVIPNQDEGDSDDDYDYEETAPVAPNHDATAPKPAPTSEKKPDPKPHPQKSSTHKTTTPKKTKNNTHSSRH